MRKLLLSTALLGASALFGGGAQALTILTLENPGLTTFQQQQNSPCVIGDPSCNNGSFAGPAIIPSGPQAQYDVSSFTYTVAQVRAVVGNTFIVGIDVNTTTQPLATEKLDLFTLSVNGTVQFIYDPASPGTQLFTVNNGNGFSDELLRGFDLSSFAATDTLVFRTIVNDATDGREQFFLLAGNATPVVPAPEPASLALLGAGLLGLGMIRRRA